MPGSVRGGLELASGYGIIENHSGFVGDYSEKKGIGTASGIAFEEQKFDFWRSYLQGFSLNRQMIQSIFSFAKPLGHNEDPEELNLGFGFLYYGLVRALHPSHVVVIGSGFGFSVVCMALGLKDNAQGILSFIDPSYNVLKNGPFKTIGGRGMWSDPEFVFRHFERFGLEKYVTHYKSTSQVFFTHYEGAGLSRVDLGFVDGNHAFKHVSHDFLFLFTISPKSNTKISQKSVKTSSNSCLI